MASNVREYPYLPEYMFETQIPETRRNPINPLQMFASGLIMTGAQVGHGKRLRGRERRRAAMDQYMYTGGRAMLYSPLGQGSLR